MHEIYRLIHEHKLPLFLFMTVGAICAFVNFGSFAILWKLMGLNYKIAVSIAYIISVVVHFFANRSFTFKSQHINMWQQLPKYLLMVLVNYLATMLVVHVVVEVLHLSPFLGLFFAIGATVVTGYTMSRFWVFKIV